MRNRKAIIAFVHDVLAAGASVVAALYLRLGDGIVNIEWSTLAIMLVAFMVVAGLSFQVFGMYRGVWRYASIDDLLNITRAATLAVLLFLPSVFILNQLALVPRSVPVIQWCLLIVALGGSRFAYRLMHRQPPFRRGESGRTVPLLLLGVGDAAEQFIRASRAGPQSPYRIAGVLDDGAEFQGRAIHGTPVLGRLDDLMAVVARLADQGTSVQRLVISDPATLDGATKQRLIECAEQLGLSIARLPRPIELRDANEEEAMRPQPIALEDLLGRPQFARDRTAVRQLIAGRRVLITGAGGTIGSELSRQIAALSPSQLVLVDSSEYQLYAIDLELRERHPTLPCQPVLCNIRERDRVMAVFAEERPELVFHAAALKHVPMVEINPGEGVLTNVAGTRNVADAAARHGALAMVQVSTDKAVKPTSVMGASKRLAEFYCQSLDLDGAGSERAARFMTVRFGNVLGSSGSVVPLFQRQLERGGPLTVTHPDIERYFMTVQEAVELVLHATAHGLEHPEARGQIFVLDMGKPAKIADVARQMIRLAGLRPGIDVGIEFTGLRPGEKLYEELFDDNEQRLAAAVDGILVAGSKSITLEVLQRVFDELAAASRHQDHATVLRLLAHVVPSYRGAAEPAVVASHRGPREPATVGVGPLFGYGANPGHLVEQT